MSIETIIAEMLEVARKMGNDRSNVDELITEWAGQLKGTASYAQCEAFAIRVLGQEAYDNSPCQAHPLELIEAYLADQLSACRTAEGAVAWRVDWHVPSDSRLHGSDLYAKQEHAEYFAGQFNKKKGMPHVEWSITPLFARPAPVASRVTDIQRYTPRLGENPVYKANITAIMEPDYYNGEWVKYSDHLKSLEAALTTPERVK